MITVADLTDQIGLKGTRPFLYCQVCREVYSANKGDYWNTPADHVFTCCDQPMILATKKTVIEEIV
jgi:hypothetical protein